MATLVVHCGAHSTEAVLDAADRALEAGLGVLQEGGNALEAVVQATLLLEDDERLNAGTGSRLNLAGEVEMDASLMDSRRECGAVAAIYGVKNPILVAREVFRTDHVLLASRGAVDFAREAGFAEYRVVTPHAREHLERVRERLAGRSPALPTHDLEPEAGDTVGAVARDEAGYMAAGNSTGGISVKLPGRVGDTPIIGAGIYAGPAGAVAATGMGEEIVRQVLSKDVYDRIHAGEPPQGACEAGLTGFPHDVPVGLIAVAASGWGAACNTRMAWRSGEV